MQQEIGLSDTSDHRQYCLGDGRPGGVGVRGSTNINPGQPGVIDVYGIPLPPPP